MSEGQEAAQKKGSPIMLILALLGGVLIGGVAVFFVLPMVTGGEEEVVEKAEPEPEETATDILKIDIERFSAPLISKKNRTLGYIWLDIVFEVDGPANQSLLAARLPRVQAAMLKALHEAPTVRDDRPGAMDFEDVEERMLSAARQAVGKRDVIYRFYIVNFQRAPT